LARNRVSRYDIAARAIASKNPEKAEEYLARKEDLLKFARKNSVDAPEIEDWEYWKFF
jgi:phosphoketolase